MLHTFGGAKINIFAQEFRTKKLQWVSKSPHVSLHGTFRISQLHTPKSKNHNNHSQSGCQSSGGSPPMPVTADYDRAVTEHIIDLVEQRGELLALIEMVPARDHLLIENIAVRPDQQGGGLGDLLLRHAETLALSMEFAETQLYTNAAFVSNLAFYSKRGYEEYRRETMVSGSTRIFMRKKLTGDA
jgi:ribosomal protein S18 acetylase RimI-like enzyme